MQQLFSKLNLRFVKPTKIQQMLWDAPLNDYVIRSPTGSGKTLAYLVQLQKFITDNNDFRPNALILTPSSLLAEQIGHDMHMIGGDVQIIHGKLGYNQRKKRTNMKSQFVVSTPGYMLKYFNEFNLKPLEFCVFDEMDVLLDPQDLDNAIPILHRIGPQTRKWFVGATLTESAQKIIDSNCPNALTLHAEPKTEAPQMIYLDSRNSNHESMMASLRGILSISKNTLIFCNKKGTEKRLCSDFSEFDPRILHNPIDEHGISTIDALKVLRYRTSTKPITLISSRLLERGIDFVHLDRIVLYDAPGTMNSLIHRIGRLRFPQKKQVIVCITDKNAGLLQDLNLIN
eukprot:NODE_38_length_30618_cov_0.377142.p8 type:complete len:343 gc:universal NODE_38_length_30618_cov_0.377142:13049-12021(-)